VESGVCGNVPCGETLCDFRPFAHCLKLIEGTVISNPVALQIGNTIHKKEFFVVKFALLLLPVPEMG